MITFLSRVAAPVDHFNVAFAVHNGNIKGSSVDEYEVPLGVVITVTSDN